jgi:hypothetical protein
MKRGWQCCVAGLYFDRTGGTTMKELIDKSVVVAEIERRKKDWQYGSSTEAKYKKEECDEILSFLDTLETKEVNLDRAIDKWIDDAAITHEDCSITDVISTAKHFFELGLKAKGE